MQAFTVDLPLITRGPLHPPEHDYQLLARSVVRVFGDIYDVVSVSHLQGLAILGARAYVIQGMVRAVVGGERAHFPYRKARDGGLRLGGDLDALDST